MGSLLLHEARIYRNKDSTLELPSKVKSIFQEVEAKVDREAEDEATTMAVTEMAETIMSINMEAAAVEAFITIKGLTNLR